MTPTTTGDPYYDRFTPEEYAAKNPDIADRPSHEDAMLGWSVPLLERRESEMPTLVAAQVAVLRGLWPDPAAWCVEAIELGRRFIADREKRGTHAHR